MFECIVAKSIWNDVDLIFGVSIVDFRSLAVHWLYNKKNAIMFLMLSCGDFGTAEMP